MISATTPPATLSTTCALKLLLQAITFTPGLFECNHVSQSVVFRLPEANITDAQIRPTTARRDHVACAMRADLTG
jgi:hypothetical protein